MKRIIPVFAAVAALAACAYQPVVDLGPEDAPDRNARVARYEADLGACRKLSADRRAANWERMAGFKADWPRSDVNDQVADVIITQRCLAAKGWTVEDWAS